MKKVFCLIIFSAMISFSAFAQITYESQYPYTPVMIYFNHFGQKWCVKPDTSNIYLYNLNHSLFRHIIIPPQTATYRGTFFLSDDLFDTDTTNIEFLLSAYPASPARYVSIYREDGTLLWTQNDVVLASVYQTTDDWYSSSILSTDSGTKMSLARWGFSYMYTEIYALPGTKACPITCGGTAYNPTVLQGIDNSNSDKSHLPFPNPTTGQTHIPYTLPDGEASGEIIFYDMAGAEVKRYKVDRTFSDLILSTSDLSAGSYYYQLVTQHSKSEGKKLIVIK